MEKKIFGYMIPSYILVFAAFVGLSIWGNRTVTTAAEAAPLPERSCIVIDAGHGGEDGGAVSCTGICESKINLEIAMRLNDILHLLGCKTYMIRSSDVSVYTKGETLAQKKVSDLKERVRLINEIENSILISIHQNYFSDSRYSGAQVFYGGNEESKPWAVSLQKSLVDHLNPGSNRQSKRSNGIYLMEQISCPAVLVECGFLSNPTEEAKLRNEQYQKKLCCVIAASAASFSLDVQTND